MRIKDLIHEVEIHFGENWETQDILLKNYPFAEKAFSNDRYATLIETETVWNTKGLIYRKGQWATADIKEKPEKWVIDMYSLSDKEKITVFAYLCFDNTPPFNKFLIMNDIGDFSFVKSMAEIETGYQLLTYQQWYSLIYMPEANA